MPDTRKMTSSEIIERLEKEKDLIVQLTGHLEKELAYITNDDAEALEDSMPDKYKLLKTIAVNREGFESITTEQESEYAEKIQGLKRDLKGLWKKASSLNELSKSMVGSRLTEIERQMEPFFAGEKIGYTRSGRKSRAFSRIVKTGA
jgi:hypothetical protein